MWLTLEEAIRRLNSPKNVASISPVSNVPPYTFMPLGSSGKSSNSSARVELESKQESTLKDTTAAFAGE